MGWKEIDKKLIRRDELIFERGREIGWGPPEYRPVEEGASTPPREVVQAYPVKRKPPNFRLGG